MESSTKTLRRLLDERGVEYDTDDEDGCEFTEWVANGLEWEADSRDELVSLMPVMLITPEQAIAATLGTGTCKVEGSIDYGEFGCWQYDLSCGCRIIWPDSEPPMFCPECGRRVVDPTTNDVDAEVGA